MNLTQKDVDDLWGETGPYSEAYIKIQTRILDDSISRIFVEVEANINPFTLNFFKKHKRIFADNIKLLDLLEHSKYMGKSLGYVVGAFSREFVCPEVLDEAQVHLHNLEAELIEMYKFVMRELGISFCDENVEFKSSENCQGNKFFNLSKWRVG